MLCFTRKGLCLLTLEPAAAHQEAARCGSYGDHTLWPAQSRRCSYLLTTPHSQLLSRQTKTFVCPLHLTKYKAALQKTPFTSVHAGCCHPRTAQDASRLSMRRTVPKKHSNSYQSGLTPCIFYRLQGMCIHYLQPKCTRMRSWKLDGGAF